MDLVSPTGSIHSPIMLISDFPDRHERAELKPFVSGKGKLLDRLLSEADLTRDDCYITFLSKEHPFDNNLRSLPQKRLFKYNQELHEEISRFQGNIIVPMGEHSFRTITGKSDFLSNRGSILTSVIYGQARKILPILHPGIIMKKWVPHRIASRYDFRKLAKECKSSEVKLQRRECIVPRSIRELKQAKSFLMDSEYLSVDIETNPKQQTIVCVGFSSSASKGYSFGLFPSHFREDKINAMELSKTIISSLLSNDSLKITQNGNFDITYLKKKGYPFKNWYMDTMYAHHLLEVELPRSLKFMTSIYTDLPYYKDMVSHSDELSSRPWMVLGNYNCLDCMVTYEIAMKLIEKLELENLDAFYQEHYTQLFEPLFEAQMEGVRIDLDKKEEIKIQLEAEKVVVAAEILKLIPSGFLVNTSRKELERIEERLRYYKHSGKDKNNDGTISKNYLRWLERKEKFTPSFNPGSDTQVSDLLYRGFRERKRYKHTSITTDDEAMTRIIRSITTRDNVRSFCVAILKYRGIVKLLTTYLNCPLDKDNRMRCEYKMARTKTARLSSSKNIFGMGTNLQNIPQNKGRDGLIRSMFLPDEGDIFVAADYKQAEARVVGYSSGEMGFIDQFETDSDLFIHIAQRIFKTLEVDKKQRTLTKKLVHATDYGQSLDGFAFNANLEINEAKEFWYQYLEDFNKLPEWRELVKETIDKERRLYNLFGRYRTFYDRVKTIIRNHDGTMVEKFNMNLIRDGYSYIPQSTVGDLLNLALVRLWKLVHEANWQIHRPKFRLQVHDEMIWSLDPADISLFLMLTKEAMDIPLVAGEFNFSIPINISSGINWGNLEELEI